MAMLCTSSKFAMNFPLDLVKYCLLDEGSPMVSGGSESRKNGDRVKIEDLERNEMKFMKRGKRDKKNKKNK